MVPAAGPLPMHEVFAFSAAGEGGTLLLQMHTQKPRAFAGVTGQGNVDPLAPPGPLQMHEVFNVFLGLGRSQGPQHPKKPRASAGVTGPGNVVPPAPPIPLQMHEVFSGSRSGVTRSHPLSENPCECTVVFIVFGEGRPQVQKASKPPVDARGF